MIRSVANDLSFVTVTVVDQNGDLVPRSNNPIQFTLDGPGEIVATDNGDPTSHLPFQLTDRAAFNGLCLVIVCAKPGASGRILLRGNSPGLNGDAIQIDVSPNPK